MAAKSGRSGETEAEKEALRSRLKTLTEHYSQRELARRIGVPQQNINAYLVRGTRVPAFFLSRIVDRLGVNPAWLLTGEGTPMLADVAANNAHMTSELLEVVQAMNSVAKMRLGALTGKDHLKTLRSLNDALRNYEDLRTTISQRCKPVYNKITEDLYTALSKNDLDQAESLVAAGDQISRLAHDGFLDSVYFMSKSTLAHYKGDYDSAIELQRRAIYSHFSTGRNPDAWFYQLSASVTSSLASHMYMEESRNTCGALLSLGRGTCEALPQYQLLEVLAGILHLESGELDTGLSKILSTNASLLPDHDSGWHSAALNRALYFKGSITLETLEKQNIEPQHKRLLILMATLWERSQEVAERATSPQTPPPTGQKNEMEELLLIYARSFLAASKGQQRTRKTALTKLQADAAKSHAPQNFVLLTLPIMQTLIAHLAGHRKKATELLHAAQNTLKAHQPRLTPPLLFRAIHYRCAVEIIPTTTTQKGDVELRDEAHTFFAEHRAHGYALNWE